MQLEPFIPPPSPRPRLLAKSFDFVTHSSRPKTFDLANSTLRAEAATAKCVQGDSSALRTGSG